MDEEKNINSADIKKLKKELEDCKAKCEEYLDGWKRERADFLNYKKEEMERIVELIKYANEELILKMLPILDNFLIAEKNIPEDIKKDKNVAGLLQIHQQLRDFLKLQGIEEIKAVGEKFDPNFHEAVGETKVTENGDPTPGESKEPGIIIEETQKGYILQGKVIRPSKVKINK
ncbi:nucleotide exchange factor GrpE [Patescibacteria group bacterium]|nr:nucleotide exchange factor GrpE [Patescibacteria group bacterium]MBU4368020.1 nucleotide exchange factor GrpE [Patescibacteria group bacterium]MBU4462255.1 nucleotide exchange factor GrpE [Patescibacteria group bacterium]MCG2699611.1 nucleotide exchange factor GrpE [Candidatus Parcubacteria bacterium]